VIELRTEEQFRISGFEKSKRSTQRTQRNSFKFLVREKQKLNAEDAEKCLW
jgi:hypothetical protein